MRRLFQNESLVIMMNWWVKFYDKITLNDTLKSQVFFLLFSTMIFFIKRIAADITSNISKSWRDRLIPISDSDFTSKITPEMIFRFPTTNTNSLFADLCNVTTTSVKNWYMLLMKWKRRSIMRLRYQWKDPVCQNEDRKEMFLSSERNAELYISGNP